MNQHTSDPRDGAETQGSVPVLIESSSMSLVLKAEIDSQITTARQYPRDMKKAIGNITTLATLDEETAAECLYALVRKKKNRGRNGAAAQDEENKPIEGPSIRLAEIAAQCWGNNRSEAHVIEVDKKEKVVVATGTFRDLETNVTHTATVRRNISTSSGYLFSADMITVTGNAACSIAKRNAILAGIPRGVYRQAYHAAREMVAGTNATLPANRDKAIKAFASFGVTVDQILDVLDLESEGEIKLDHIATLRAMFMSIKNGEATVEEMFAKEKQTDADPDRNPLVKGGAGTNDRISTGGQTHEVNDNTDKGDPRADGTSSTENRSAAAQTGGQAGAAPATDSAAAGTAAHPSGHAAGHQPAAGSDSAATAASRQASAQPAPADAGASSSPHEDSPQRDLLSGATTRDGSGQPADRQAEGAGGSRGETTPAPTRHPATPERLQSYSKALATIENGGPAKLGKQSMAWITRNGDFDAAGNETAGKILSVHTQRVAGEITMEACLKRVKEITG